MSVTTTSISVGGPSRSWFGAKSAARSVALDHAGALVGEPGDPKEPVAELLESAAINAAFERQAAGELLARLTPELLADMTNDASDDTRVTRQVPLAADQSVEVTVHRLPVSDDDADAGWLFQQLWVAAF